MKLKITKPFAFAHRGCDVVQYTAGQEVDTEDQDLIDTALAEKWATKARESRQTKAIPGAPENKGDTGTSTGTDADDGADDGDDPELDPDHKGGDNNPLTAADAAADLAGEARPA